MGNKRYTYYATEVGTLPAKICSRKTEPPPGYSRAKSEVIPHTESVTVVVQEIRPVDQVQLSFEVVSPTEKSESKSVEGSSPSVTELPAATEKVTVRSSLKSDEPLPEDTLMQRLRDAREENARLKQLLDFKSPTISEETYFEMKNQLEGHKTRAAFLTEELNRLKELVGQEQSGKSKIRSFYGKYQEALEVYQGNMDAAVQEIRGLVFKIEELERLVPKTEPPAKPLEPKVPRFQQTSETLMEVSPDWPNQTPVCSFGPPKPKAPPLSLRERLEQRISIWSRRNNEKVQAIEVQRASAELKSLIIE